MLNEQMEIPGLEKLGQAVKRAQEKRKSLEERFLELKDRVLKLELEVALLRIQLEKWEGVSK